MWFHLVLFQLVSGLNEDDAGDDEADAESDRKNYYICYHDYAATVGDNKSPTIIPSTAPPTTVSKSSATALSPTETPTETTSMSQEQKQIADLEKRLSELQQQVSGKCQRFSQLEPL